MPYSWDRTRRLLEGGNESSQGQQVISSSEGDLSGGSQNTQQSQPQRQTDAGSKSAVLMRNVGGVKSPTSLQNIAGGVSSARQSLQDQANAFVSSADQDVQGLRQNLKSNIKDYATSGRGGDWMTAGKVARRVAGPELRADPRAEDVNLLKTDQGIQQLFRRQQDAEGSFGEAALNAALLKKDKDFSSDRDLLLREYDDYQKFAGSLPEEARAKAQARLDEAQKLYNQELEAEAQNLAQSIESGVAQRESDIDQQLLAAEELRRSKVRDEAQAELARAASSGLYDPDTADYLNQAFQDNLNFRPDAIRTELTQNLKTRQIDPQMENITKVDPSLYYQAGLSGQDTSLQDFYSEDESNQFNRIMALLGRGDKRMAGKFSGKKAEDILGGGLDKSRLVDDVLKASAPFATTQSEKRQAIAREKADQEAIREEQRKKDEADAKVRKEKLEKKKAAEKQAKITAALKKSDKALGRAR